MSDGAIHRGLVWLLGSSWRMTVLGFGAGVALVWPELSKAFDGDAATLVNWSNVMAGLGVAVMGRIARDNAVSSEQAGIAPKTPVESLIHEISKGTKIPIRGTIGGDSEERRRADLARVDEADTHNGVKP